MIPRTQQRRPHIRQSQFRSFRATRLSRVGRTQSAHYGGPLPPIGASGLCRRVEADGGRPTRPTQLPAATPESAARRKQAAARGSPGIRPAAHEQHGGGPPGYRSAKKRPEQQNRERLRAVIRERLPFARSVAAEAAAGRGRGRELFLKLAACGRRWDSGLSTAIYSTDSTV